MENYLSIGKKDINYVEFRPIKNSDSSKPHGGLWATTYNSMYPSYNEWMDFLVCHPNVLFYKYLKNGNFNIPAVFFTLKNDAKILHINTKAYFLQAKMNYPNNDKLFDFEKIAIDYDGIFIGTTSLLNALNEAEIITIKPYDVNTLILFNLNAIDYYQETEIVIEPFDYETKNELIEYEIKIAKEKKQVISENTLTRKRPE